MARKSKAVGRNWQRTARILWWVLFLLFLFVYINDLVIALSHFELVFDAVLTHEFNPASMAQALSKLGWSNTLFLQLYLLPEILATLGFLAVGFLIGLRRSGDWFTWFVSVWMIMFGVTSPSTYALSGAGSELLPLYYIPIFLSYAGIVVFLFAFPDGKFNPPWTRGLAIAWSLFVGSTLIVPWFAWESAASAVVIVPLLVAVLYSYVYRYRNVFTRTQQEQTKWLIAAIILNIILVATSGVLASKAAAVAGQPESVTYILVSNAAEYIGNLLLVAAVGISILRYRLWDIEVVINRALIYGPLSVILAGVFAISVVIFNQSARQLFGTEDANTSAIIAALIVATVFTPLRTRIEKGINVKVYADSMNLSRELVEINDPRFALSAPALVRLVAQRITRVLKSEAGGVYLGDGRAFKRAAAVGNLPAQLSPEAKVRTALTAGKVTSDGADHLLVPLYVPRLRSKELLGVLALGLRKDGHGYSSDDRSALAELGGQIGTALHAARLRKNN